MFSQAFEGIRKEEETKAAAEAEAAARAAEAAAAAELQAWRDECNAQRDRVRGPKPTTDKLRLEAKEGGAAGQVPCPCHLYHPYRAGRAAPTGDAPFATSAAPAAPRAAAAAASAAPAASRFSPCSLFSWRGGGAGRPRKHSSTITSCITSCIT